MKLLNCCKQAESAYLSALTAVEGLKETEDGTSKHELLQFIDEVEEFNAVVCVCTARKCLNLFIN